MARKHVLDKTEPIPEFVNFFVLLQIHADQKYHNSIEYILLSILKGYPIYILANRINFLIQPSMHYLTKINTPSLLFYKKYELLWLTYEQIFCNICFIYEHKKVSN